MAIAAAVARIRIVSIHAEEAKKHASVSAEMMIGHKCRLWCLNLFVDMVRTWSGVLLFSADFEAHAHNKLQSLEGRVAVVELESYILATGTVW